MKQNRVDRIMAALKEMGLHQMLIVDPMSIYYLTGVYVSPFERFYGLYLREDGHHAFFLKCFQNKDTIVFLHFHAIHSSSHSFLHFMFFQ